MRTLFLHIGFGKTGTTALQSWFSMNTSLLKEAGIYYHNPKNFGYNYQLSSGNGETLASYLRGKIDSEKLKENYFSNDYQKILISSELLALDSEKILKIIDFCKLENINLAIIAFIRDAYEWLYSCYIQKIKRQDVNITFDDFIRDRDIELLYNRIILISSEIANMSGPNYFHLFHYNKYKKNLLVPFEKVMNFKSNMGSSIKNRKVNRSLNLDELFIVKNFIKWNLEFQESYPGEPIIISRIISDWLVDNFHDKKNEILINSDLIEICKEHCSKYVDRFNSEFGKIVGIDLKIHDLSEAIETPKSVEYFNLDILREVCQSLHLRASEIGRERLLYFSNKLKTIDPISSTIFMLT